MPTPTNAPLAEIMRPRSLDDFFGQEHLVGKNAVLRNLIESGNMHSMIFWGPPGVGKTTLASIISNVCNCKFYTLSAINSGVKDVREVIEQASKEPKAILFIDEIHRFNKSQQDSLLGAVEKGTITLIGATTENPSFEVITPLLSRCQVYVLKQLEKIDLENLLEKGRKKLEEIHSRTIKISESEALIGFSGGDGRKLLNIFELTTKIISGDTIDITNELVEKSIQKNLAIYDKNGEMHYDVISAFIKSMRGSDPNAAIYWLARMIEGGEDPLFIARRMLILASEDIGNANPNALLLANSCFDAVNKIGFPESRILLAQTVIYLAQSPKSNASYMAINKAQDLVRKTGNQPVPMHIRNAPTKLMKELGYGEKYKYAHDFDGNFVEQEFLPENISGAVFYEPQNNTAEIKIRERLRALWGKRYRY